MPRLLTICDTNVYRAHGPDEFQVVRRLERSHGIQGVGSQWVVLELMSHLSEETDPSFKPSWRGIKSLKVHTCIWDYTEKIPLLSSPRTTIERELFRYKDPELHRAAIEFATIARNLANSTTAAEVLAYSQVTAGVRDMLALHEQTYVEQIQSLLDELEEKQATRQQILPIIREHGIRWAATRMVRELEVTTGKRIVESDEEPLVDEIIRLTPTAVYFFHHTIETIINSGGEIDLQLPKHRNSLWDRELALYVSNEMGGEDAPFANRSPTVLLTAEKNLRRAAADAGQAPHVLHFDDYVEILESDDISELPCKA